MERWVMGNLSIAIGILILARREQFVRHIVTWQEQLRHVRYGPQETTAVTGVATATAIGFIVVGILRVAGIG